MCIDISRIVESKTSTYKARIITPMFLHGANPDVLELRPAPFRAALRFWWRALYGGDIATTENMYEQESSIFGSTKERSRVRLDLSTHELTPLRKEPNLGLFGEHKTSLYKYLAYGQVNLKRHDNKSLPSTCDTFALNVTMSGEKALVQVTNALFLLTRLGGLGAKSRNGFGSIDVIGLKPSPDFQSRVNTAIGSAPKPFCSFSTKTRLFVFPEKETWEMALTFAGLAYSDSPLGKHHLKRQAKPVYIHVGRVGQFFRSQILIMEVSPNPYNNPNAFMRLADSCTQRGGREVPLWEALS